MWPLYLLIAIVVVVLAVAYWCTLHVPTLDLNGKHVVITGASEGLGLALAIQLAAKGAHLSLISRSQEKLKTAVAQVKTAAKSSSQRIYIYEADVADRARVKEVIGEAVSLEAKVDVLICCAGFCRPGRVDETDPTWFQKHLDVNYLGHVHSVLATLPYMKAQNYGRIVGVLSVLGLNSLPGYSAYSGAKYAARGFYESLSWEVAPFNINVSIGVPGTILSPGYIEENKSKPPETIEAEADSPQQTPGQIAAKFVKDIEHWRAYISPSGMDTDVSVMMCSGLSQVSFKEALLQIVGASLIRFVSLFLHIAKVRRIVAKHIGPKAQKKKQ